MNATKKTKAISKTWLLLAALVGVALSLTATAYAAAPGITGGTGTTATFNLTAQPAHITQPDGQFIYSWGYGCSAAPSSFAPSAIAGATCSNMQVPGPTLIVTQGQSVTVHLTNGLPTAAGNTSILFPGFNVSATGGAPGLLTQEAAPGGTVTYTFTATTPGTRSYYSGTQGDLQVEMGLYGAIIVLPSTIPAACTTGVHSSNLTAQTHWGESDFRLAAAAYNHPGACYDREYLFQFSEMDPRIHREAEEQSTRSCTGCMSVATEPYVPAYFMVNGRSMPDLMDPNYAAQYPHQPYNGNPHLHPGELYCCALSARGVGSTRSTSTATTSASWPATGTSSSARTPPARTWPARCCSPPPPRPARPWTGSTTGPGRG